MNREIKEARDLALRILNPTRQELRHGLELHKNSLVIDAYGFAPRCAVDGDILRRAVEAGASEAEIQDMQEDMAMTRYLSNAAERTEFMSAWDTAGVTCILQNAGEEGQDIRRLVKRLARFTYVTDVMRDFIQKAVNPDDIVTVKKRNGHCLYLSANGVPLPQDWVSAEEELRYIKIFYQLGIRMMHLTYNRRNVIGEGCAEPTNGGLSDFGREVVAEMNRIGVIADVAHSGQQTSLDAAKISKRPVVASHTGCSAVNGHIRCKTDEVIQAISDAGGYVGICCIPSFLGGRGDISTMLDHISYVVDTFGADHVAIGTDVAYISHNAEDEWRKVPPRPRMRSGWESLWPPGSLGADKPEQTLSMAWTNWPLFTVGLVQRGYADDEIRKIIGGNTLRVARAMFT